MKEKLIKIITNNKIILISLLLVIIIILFWTKELIKYNINKQQELENIQVDEYNFKQLKKVKNILVGVDFTDMDYFYGLKEFNDKFNSDIEPIKDCYYVSNKNGDEDYIFGFQLYSKKYQEMYGEEYYAYPKYNIEEMIVCTGKCYDLHLNRFKRVISNSCAN